MRPSHPLRGSLLAAVLLSAAARAAGPAASADDSAHSPIRHVIVIIGENRSFDHVFATYAPVKGESVWNLPVATTIPATCNRWISSAMGPRIPFIVVSRFNRAGYVSHQYTDHVSILKFIERNWGLAPVTTRSRDNLPNPVTRDAAPYVPVNSRAIGDLSDLFDFGGV